MGVAQGRLVAYLSVKKGKTLTATGNRTPRVAYWHVRNIPLRYIAAADFEAQRAEKFFIIVVDHGGGKFFLL